MELLKSESNIRPDLFFEDGVILDVNLNVTEITRVREGVEPNTTNTETIYVYDTYRYTKGEVSNKIVALIRTRYSGDDEFAILRQRDEKPSEFKEYNDFAEECKNKVNEFLNK